MPKPEQVYKLQDAAAAVAEHGTLLAIAQYPNSPFLFLVLIEEQPGDFVVWTYNAQAGGVGNGDYYLTSADYSTEVQRACAARHFAIRFKDRIPTWTAG